MSFEATDKRDGTTDNLQDTFEIPYWILIADLFDNVRSNTLNRNTLGADAILLVLNSTTVNVEENISRLKSIAQDNVPEPILEGISRRINALRDLLNFMGFETNGKDGFTSPVNANPRSTETYPDHNHDVSIFSGENSGEENNAQVRNRPPIVLEFH